MNYQELRGKSPQEIFDAVSKDSGIPSRLLQNVWTVESGNGKNMKSPAGAVGHMQIMPRELGVMRKTYGEDLDPMELADSVFMAGKMLKENLQHFGNIPDAVSAYNGGWNKSRWNNAETRAYTPKVLNGTGISFDDKGIPAVSNAYATSRSQIDAVRPEPTVQKPTYLNQLEKNAIEQNMLHSQLAGTSDDAVVQEAVALRNNPQAAYGLAENISQAPPTTDYANADAAMAEGIGDSVHEAERLENQTIGDYASAAFQQFSLTTSIMEAAAKTQADIADAKSEVDKQWMQEYEAKRSEMIKGLSPYAVNDLDRAINAKEAAAIVERDKRDQVNQQILNDSGHPMLWGITAGVLDPAGWAVGLGVGKVFQLGKGISMAGRMAEMAASNAAGNVAITGAMDMLGHQTTMEDYIHSAGFGLATGAVLGAFSRGAKAEVEQAAVDTHAKAAARTEAFAKKAESDLRKSNPNVEPTADDIARAASQASNDEVQNIVDQVLSQTDDSAKVFKPNTPDPVETGRVQETYGLDTVVDENRLSSIGSLYKSAEGFLETNKGTIRSVEIEAQKNRKLSDVMGWRSSGNELLSDANPLAKAIGMTVAEDASGVSGYRGVTVSIKSRLLGNYFNHGIERGIHENLVEYMTKKGIGRAQGALETYTTGKHATQFYSDVATEIRRRADPNFKSSAPASVQKAANVIERGFQEMGDSQRAAKTLGSDFIPKESRGYLPQQLNGKAFAALSKSEKRQVQQEFMRQAREVFGWDTEFASKKVAEYMNRAEDRALPGGGFQGNAGSDLMGVLLEDLNHTMSPEQYAKTIERLHAGAAKHTHKRLDWDLDASIRMDDGSVKPLSSLYNNDILSLYKSYANRAAGDISFAHVGIYGDRDINLIQEALQRSSVGDSTKTIPAFKHLVNEVYNRPTATDSGGAFSTSARFIRQYTGIRLLGGVGFAQAAELSNAVAHMGVGHTLNLVTRIPKVWKDLKTLKRGEIPENSVLESLDMVAGSPLGAEQFQMVMPQVIDEGLSIVNQKSFNGVMRTLGGAQLLHNKFSFMRAVQAVEQRVVSEEIVRKAFRYMKSGKEDVALKEMGFTSELQGKLMKEMDNIAQFDDRGYLKALNVMHMEDKGALAELLTAVRRGTGQIIQETYPGETGKWMRSEVGQLLIQFRKFPSVAVEKQMNRQFGKFGFAKAMGGVLTSMGVGTLVYMGRAQLAASMMSEKDRKKYLDNRLSVAGIANGAMMYVSALGMATDFMQMGSGVGGMLDDSMDLGWSGSRGVQSSGIGGLIPSLGTLSDAYNFTQDPSAKGALKMLPFTNLPMVLPAINALKSATNDD